MSRRPCAHCQRLWSAQTLVTVGAAELCPVCYKQRRWTRRLWPCRDCTLETDRTLVCHDECQRYAMHRALIWAGKPSANDRAAAEVTLEGNCGASVIAVRARSPKDKSRRRRGNSDDGKGKKPRDKYI